MTVENVLMLIVVIILFLFGISVAIAACFLFRRDTKKLRTLERDMSTMCAILSEVDYAPDEDDDQYD